MAKSKFITAAILAAAITPASADFSGHDLKRMCRPDPSDTAAGFCIGFGLGAVGAFATGMGDIMKKEGICFKKDMDGEAIQTALTEYLSWAPEQELALPAENFVFLVMTESCPKGGDK